MTDVEHHKASNMSGSTEPSEVVSLEVPSPLASKTGPAVFKVSDLAVYYGSFRAVRDVQLEVRQHEITAFIGPSGCGKTTVLRCFNRMNDIIESTRVEGTSSAITGWICTVPTSRLPR